MNSPLKDLRQRAGLTLEAAAGSMGVSKQYLILCEKAVYTEPSEVVVTYYAGRVDGVDYEEVTANYHIFQRETRRANYGRLIEPWNFVIENHARHPFISWREYSGIESASAICKLFCVHPAVLHKFERKPNQMANVPEQLLVGLLESGYKVETLNLLEEAYRVYKIILQHDMEVYLPVEQEG